MLGDTIQQLRMDRGITQVQLAQLADINRSYLSVVENGHSSPTVEVLERIAAALNVSVWVLLAETKERHYTLESDEEQEMLEGLSDFLNDPDEVMLAQPTAAEIEELKKIVFRGSARPDKRFYRDALLFLRRSRQSDSSKS